MKNPLLALLLACAASPVGAQTIVYHDDPNPTTGGSNAFPFGAEGVRTQQLIPQAVLGANPFLIRDLYVNPRISANNTITSSQVWYGDFEIRMGLTTLTTLTNTWTTNSPNPTVVYRGPLLVLFQRDQWVPLGLPEPFLWAPTSPAENLVVDFICWDVIDTGAVVPGASGYFMDSRRSVNGSISRAYRLGWTSSQPATSTGVDGAGIKLGFLVNDGNFVVHDGDCPGSSGLVPAVGAVPGTWPQPGQAFDVTLQQGPASSVATFVLGTTFGQYLGVSLPFDMGLLGAPGCRFWHGWELLLSPVPTDASGAATVSMQFPIVMPLPFQIYGTWLAFDPAANGFGFVPSGFLTMNF